jgi:hypothetical protein
VRRITFFECYILHEDESGREFADALITKANLRMIASSATSPIFIAEWLGVTKVFLLIVRNKRDNARNREQSRNLSKRIGLGST